MTVLATSSQTGPFTPDGVVTAFPFTFIAASASEVQVVRRPTVGADVVLAAFTVTLNPDGTGTARFSVAPAVGDPIYVLSSPNFQQQVSFANQGSWSPATMNKALDRAAIRAIYLKNLLLGFIANGAVGPTGSKGDPGGNIAAIGLFSAGSSLSIPTGTNIVKTSGYSTDGIGAAEYVYDVSVNSAYVTANARTSFISSNARGFRLSTDQTLKATMFGQVGAADDALTLQAAIDYAATLGTTLVFPARVCLHSGLVFKNKVQYRGEGRDTGQALGTILLYTGTGDGVQVNNPINSATPANIIVEGIAFKNQTRTAGKGSFADTGSTDIKFRNCGFFGSDRGLILDQTELADATDCEFVPGAGSTCGVWIVNGADRNGGASAGYTNRISISRSQFNGVATAYGVLDDGGNSHSFVDNNYNGCLNHIRAAGVTGLKISGGEFEGAASSPIYFTYQPLSGGAGVGGCSAVYIGDGAEIVPAAGQSCIFAVSLGNITINTVFFGNTTSAKFVGAGNADSIFAEHCFNAGGGATFDGRANNHWEVGTDGSTNAIRTNLPLQSIGPIGYVTGAGGVVVQATSKATGVTLNKVCGQITLNNAALAANTVVSFLLTNSAIAADDDVRVWVKSGNAAAGSYRVAAEGNSLGSRTIIVENKTGGSLSEALALGFSIIKAVPA